MKNNTHNPFQRNMLAEHANVGAVAIEQERAVAEAQGKLVIAKRFPRDEARAFQMAMDACSRPSLAAVATYLFPRGGQSVSGPSIRLAEELARCWGNIDYGIRELSRKEGVSEMEAYAWDLQTNTMSSQKFTVRHIRDKKGGGVALTEERDIYEATANMGARRLRARLLAILPPDLVEAAANQCRAALAGDTREPIADRVRSMLGAFAQFGVKEAQLSTYLGKSLDDVLEDDIVNLREVYNSIQQGISTASEWFSPKKEPETSGGTTAEFLFANIPEQKQDTSKSVQKRVQAQQQEPAPDIKQYPENQPEQPHEVVSQDVPQETEPPDASAIAENWIFRIEAAETMAELQTLFTAAKSELAGTPWVTNIAQAKDERKAALA